MRKKRQEYMPTQEEIAEVCLEIQAGWTHQEFYSRAGFIGGAPKGWMPPGGLTGGIRVDAGKVFENEN